MGLRQLLTMSISSTKRYRRARAKNLCCLYGFLSSLGSRNICFVTMSTPSSVTDTPSTIPSHPSKCLPLQSSLTLTLLAQTLLRSLELQSTYGGTTMGLMVKENNAIPSHLLLDCILQGGDCMSLLLMMEMGTRTACLCPTWSLVVSLGALGSGVRGIS